MRRFGRIVLRTGVALVILAAALAIAGVLVVRSGWFREKVRERLIAEVTKSTNARVELGSFDFDWTHLTATVAPFVLHGKEAGGEAPLLQISSIALGIRIISAFEQKVDLSSLKVQSPQVHIVVYPDGTTNLPDPPHKTKSWAENLIDLKVGRYEVAKGLLDYDNRKTPIAMRGENLRLQMSYAEKDPSYGGELSSQHVRIMSDVMDPLEADLSARFKLTKTRIEFAQIRAATKESRVELTGALEDIRAPHGTFTLKATVPVREPVALFHLPLSPTGTGVFDGRATVSFAKGFDYNVAGRVDARGVGYTNGRLKIQNASMRAFLNLVGDKLTLRNMTANALNSTFTGQADLTNWKTFHTEGKFDGLSVRDAAGIVTDTPIAWNGMLTGLVTADAVIGQDVAKVQASVNITPAPDGTPIEGQLDVAYDQQSDMLKLGSSYIATPATRIDLTGTLGQTLQVRARSTNLDDLLPALAMASDDAPKELPLKLREGSATFTGTVTGQLKDPHAAGKLEVISGSVEGHDFDRFSTDVDATLRRIRLRGVSLTRGMTEVQGSAEIAATAGKFDNGMIFAELDVRNASVAELSKEAGVTTALSGTAAASARVTGTVRDPGVDLKFQVDKPAAYGEQADRISGTLRYSAIELDITQGQADAGPGKLQFQANYRHPANDWHSGDVKFDVGAQSMAVSRSQTLAKIQPGIDGTLDGKFTGTARVVKNQLDLTSGTGDLTLRGATYNRQPIGDFTATAQTRGDDLSVRLNGQVREGTLQADGSWHMTGDYPGTANIKFSKVSVATLHSLVTIAGKNDDQAGAPMDGFVEGGGTLSVPLKKPRDFRAELTLDTLQLNPKQSQAAKLGAQPQDLVLKNSRPVKIAITAKEARIDAAQFTARETNLEVSGGVPFEAKTGADLAVKGNVNLTILQLVNPDLVARGNATVQASIRGSLSDPQVNGRLEMKGASLYMNDVPTGLDNAQGAVQFDRNRATIEKLTAEVGGGSVSVSGFVEFSSILVYRLQAQARTVRVRYNDIGITFNSTLALNGTSDTSTLSGVLTLNRATVDPRADLGNLLATSTKPGPSIDEDDYLRGMQLDVRVESGPSFQLQTSLARDVEAEVDLRLRGTPARPTLLGSISVDQGEIEIFGNRYTIDRGDIRFLNPVKIEPNLDLSLETKVRGITVNIAVSGTPQKLNPNYSSDPPLQPRDIIALLAVGRAPSTATGLPNTQSSTGSSTFADAGGGLLGQAVSAQLSSRLQRFFGASRVKIDPTVTGIDYLPQARLTLEQQVSKDITLTYITNLNRTQEQIVQVQWDINQRWSAVAVREASGLFGIDFLYKKRFK